MSKHIAKETLAYFAGFVDGEGCIGLYGRKKNGKKIRSHSLVVRITNTNPLPLRRGQKIFGGIVKPVKYFAIHFPTKKIVWKWNISGKMAEFFLGKIVDYLIIKKQEALLALEFRKTILKTGKQKNREVVTDELWSRREKLAEEIKELKHREWVM